MSTLARVIFDPDTTPPSIPAGVTGTPFSSTRIDLAWTPSVDTGGSGMAGYLVFRNGAQVGAPSSAAFSDTGLTASTAYVYRVAAVDAAGNISTQSTAISVTTQANVGPPVYAPVQPAVAFIGIAGVRTYTDPTQQAAIGRYNLFVMGASWEGWAASGRDLDTIVKAIKAASTAQSGMVLLNYQNLNAVEEDANDPYPTWTAEVATRNWRLYVSGSTGSLVNPNSGAATALVNYTAFVPQNPSLEYPYDFGAKYSYYKFLTKPKSDARFSALAAGLASSSLDGVYQDNFLANPQVNGDWNRDGTTEGQGWPSTETPWLQAGQLRYCTTMRALAPTKYVFVNGGDYGLVTPGVMGQQADGMLAESYMGKYWSWETQRGFVTVLGYYYKVLAAAASPNLVVFGGSWPDTNPDGSALTRLPTANGYPPLNTQWQWARYIAATALLGEGMHAINRLSQGYSSDLAALDWYDFDGGVNGLPRGWLGAPVDALRPTTPKIAKGALGIYGVQYTGGIVLVNPVGNGTQTVTAADIPGSWKFLPGTQDPTRDSGATFSSVSLPERDGLFLRKAAAFTPLVHKSFDGLINAQAVYGTGSIAGKNWDAVPGNTPFAAGFGMQATTAIARPGQTSCCALSIKAGSDGDPSGGDTGVGMGAFGGYVSIPTPVAEGQEIWWGAWMLFPTGWRWDSSRSQSLIKFMRYQHTAASSHMDIYVLNGNYDFRPQETYTVGASAQSGWGFRNEYFPVANADTDFSAPPSGVLPLNGWVWIEQYTLATATAANAVRRMWVNNTFVMEQVGNAAKWRDHTGTIRTKTLSNAIETLAASSDVLNSAAHFTYWNNYAPQNQTCYIADILLHKTRSDLTARDEFGNAMIGSGVF